jgi:FkbM family methyltransferase
MNTMKSAAWFRYWVKRGLTRPRALFRSARSVGVGITAALVRIRFGSADRIYSLKVPQWPHPVYVRGGKSSDTTILYEILVTNEYRLDKLQSPATIIDGGANIGLACVALLNRFPSAHIISVEPFAGTFEVCRKNLAAYGKRATALQGAIWPKEGRVSLDPQAEDCANKVGTPVAGDTATAEAFTMPALIQAAGGFVDLLKLDVEGSELEIFGPGAGEWLPFVRNIVIELHGQDCFDRFFGALDGYDYDLSSHDQVYSCMNLRRRL